MTESENISREAVDEYITNLLSGYLYDEERTRLENLSAFVWELPSVTPKALEQQPDVKTIYNIAFTDGVNAYKNVIELAEEEKEEPAEWIVDTDDSRRWDRVRFYCSSCNDWNTYGKSKYCPNCGAKMEEI